MIDPIALGQTKEYIANSDKKSDTPTIWIIGAIDSMEKSKIISEMIESTVDEEGNPIIKRKQEEISGDFNVVKYGLKGWKNFGSLEFKTIKEKLWDREREVLTDELLKCIPLTIIHELANVIWGENQVSDKLEKN